MRSVLILKIVNSIPSSSLPYGLVEVLSVPVTLDGPFLFGSLAVVLFLFGCEVLMLVVEMFLERVILLGWVEVLLV